jgi:uncharacterized protein involved in exopolysaccharide biosynthesis
MKTSEELEFRDLAILFLKRSWIIAITVGVAVWIGHRRAAALPNLYKSTALLVPAASNNQRSASSVTLGSSTTGSPDLSLYQALMTSRTVMMDILRKQTMRPARDLSPQLVAKFFGVDTSNATAMQQAATSLSKSVTLVDQGDGIIEVSFTSTDPQLAPQVADMVIEVTQRELNRIRTDRLQTILTQLQKSVDEAHYRYSAASGALANFKDANIEMESGRLQGRSAELESDLKVREEDYQQSRSRADQMRLELDQLYPPAVVFDPASRPALLVGPNRQNMVMVAGLVGLIVGVLIILAWEFLLRKKPE